MATNSDNAKTAMPSQKSGIDHFNSSETDPKKSGAMSKYLRYVLLTSVFKEIKSSSKLFLGGRVTFFSWPSIFLLLMKISWSREFSLGN